MGRVKGTVMIHRRVQAITKILFTQERKHPPTKEIRSHQLNSQLVHKRKNQQLTVLPLKHGLKNWEFLVYGATVNPIPMWIITVKTRRVPDKGLIAATVIVKKLDAGDPDHPEDKEGQGQEIGHQESEARNIFAVDQFHAHQIDQGIGGGVKGREDQGQIVGEGGEDSVAGPEV